MENNNYQNLTLLEKRALQVQDALMSGDESKIDMAVFNFEKSIAFAELDAITMQNHYLLLGSSLLYVLTTIKPDDLMYVARYKKILYTTQYCLLRYIRDVEKGKIETLQSEYVGAVKRAFICSKMFNDVLTMDVYSFISGDLHMGQVVIDTLYLKLKKSGIEVMCDKITETLYTKQISQQNTSLVEKYSDAEENIVNNFIDKVLLEYETNVLVDVIERILDEYYTYI